MIKKILNLFSEHPEVTFISGQLCFTSLKNDLFIVYFPTSEELNSYPILRDMVKYGNDIEHRLKFNKEHELIEVSGHVKVIEYNEDGLAIRISLKNCGTWRDDNARY